MSYASSSCYTPIRFIKTEVIDVEKTQAAIQGTESTVTGHFFEEKEDPTFLGYDQYILKALPSGVTKGLKNYGQTCFMNSILQVLANLPATYNLLMNPGEELHELHSSIFVAAQRALHEDHSSFNLTKYLRDLLPLMHSYTAKVVSPINLTKNISYINSKFVPYKQNDALTLFRSLIKVVSNEDPSMRRLSQLFQGEDKRRLSCPKCKHVQVVYQAFSDVAIVVIAAYLTSQ